MKKLIIASLIAATVTGCASTTVTEENSLDGRLKTKIVRNDKGLLQSTLTTTESCTLDFDLGRTSGVVPSCGTYYDEDGSVLAGLLYVALPAKIVADSIKGSGDTNYVNSNSSSRSSSGANARVKMP